MTKKIVIIGAGYGGLALANLLAKAGHTVAVYEKNQAAGGRIQAVEQDGFVFDLGPSWYLMPEIFEQYYQLFDRSAREELDLVRVSILAATGRSATGRASPASMASCQ